MASVEQETTEAAVPAVAAIDPRVIVIREAAAAESHESGALKVFAQVVQLVKAVAWPLLVAVFFLVYRDTAGQVAEQIPLLLAHATKVSAGGLAVEIKDQAEQAGGSRLSEVVTSLDAVEVERLLKVGCGGWGFFTTGMGPRVYEEQMGKDHALLTKLEARHLVAFSLDREPMTLKEVDAAVSRLPRWDGGENHPNMAGSRYFVLPAEAPRGAPDISRVQYALTDLGRSAFNSILAAIVAQLPGKGTMPASVGCSATGSR